MSENKEGTKYVYVTKTIDGNKYDYWYAVEPGEDEESIQNDMEFSFGYKSQEEWFMQKIKEYIRNEVKEDEKRKDSTNGS